MKTLIAIAALFCAVPQQEMPKPGKEHEALKQFEGEWSFEGKFYMDPSQPPAEMKGTETSKMVLGGWYLNSEVKSTFMGAPFEGRWTMTYSLFTKKYQASWIDSMMAHIFVSEGEVDANGKTFTLKGQGYDMSGKRQEERWVIEIKDADTHTMTFYGPGPDGKEKKSGEITYKRKK
ncbi:MAG TPA: DUF1579 domain-containing protein [Planctomycetota bacterium]|nr:DUF1579 domain-containing protein [Planctomycetota bacterium]